MTNPRDAAAIADALSRALAPVGEDLVAWTARTARAVFGAAACSIALLTEDGTELVFTTASGGASDITGQRLPAGEGIAGWVATTGQPLAVSDLDRDPRFASSFASSVGYTPTAILASPIETEDRLLGVIEVLDRDVRRSGSDDDLALLTLFGRQAAVALEAAARSQRVGAVMLHALGHDGDDLAAALRGSSGDGEELSRLAASFADLAAAGPDERELAATVLSAVAAYARGRP